PGARRRAAAHPLRHRVCRSAAGPVVVRGAPRRGEARSLGLVALRTHRHDLRGELVGLQRPAPGHDPGADRRQRAAALSGDDRHAGLCPRAGGAVPARRPHGGPERRGPAAHPSLHGAPDVCGQRNHDPDWGVSPLGHVQRLLASCWRLSPVQFSKEGRWTMMGNQSAALARARDLTTMSLIARVLAGGVLAAVVLTIFARLVPGGNPSTTFSPQNIAIRLVSGILYVAIMTP